jgi:hypothetical protein
VAVAAPLKETVVAALGAGLIAPEIAKVWLTGSGAVGVVGLVGEVTPVLGLTLPVQPMPHTIAAATASRNTALPLHHGRLSSCLEDRISLRTIHGSGYQEAAEPRCGTKV